MKQDLGVRPVVQPSVLFHSLAGAWIVSMLWLGTSDVERYRTLLQEDRIIEWGTVWLFLAAGVIGLNRAVRGRRLFDGLVALFCLFVAGEEISWGQRLLGYSAPEFFLRNNFQQELTLHNLPQWAVQPKWFLMAALAGYGVLLPLLSANGRLRVLMGRAGATPPLVRLSPWYVAAVALLLWYPLTLTGEWVEGLSGLLFLASLGPAPVTFWWTLTLTAVFGAAMTPLAGAIERGRDPGRTACATNEVRALLDDIAGDDRPSRLWEMRRVHKRIWSSIGDGYLAADQLRRFAAAPCPGFPEPTLDARRRYGIDPWGSAYWLLVERVDSSEWRVGVYSFGPNRRRDISSSGANAAGASETPIETEDAEAREQGRDDTGGPADDVMVVTRVVREEPN